MPKENLKSLRKRLAELNNKLKRGDAGEDMGYVMRSDVLKHIKSIEAQIKAIINT